MAKNKHNIHKNWSVSVDRTPANKTKLQQNLLVYKVQIGTFKRKNKALENLRNISIYIDENLIK